MQITVVPFFFLSCHYPLLFSPQFPLSLSQRGELFRPVRNLIKTKTSLFTIQVNFMEKLWLCPFFEKEEKGALACKEEINREREDGWEGCIVVGFIHSWFCGWWHIHSTCKKLRVSPSVLFYLRFPASWHTQYIIKHQLLR